MEGLSDKLVIHISMDILDQRLFCPFELITDHVITLHSVDPQLWRQNPRICLNEELRTVHDLRSSSHHWCMVGLIWMPLPY